MKLTRDGERAVFPPSEVCQGIIGVGGWNFPKLDRITPIPVFRSDGSLVDRPGYDQTSRVIYDPAPGFAMSDIPLAPALCEVQQGISLLTEMVADFPFAGVASRTNYFGYLLTPLLLELITGPVPMAVISSTTPGSGKGLLAAIAALILTGQPANMCGLANATNRHGDEEVRKMLTSQLLTGASVIVFDNVEGALDSGTLARFLACPYWQDRILGASRMESLPQRTTTALTGNNVQFSYELARRVYLVELRPDSARPFDRDPAGFVHPRPDAWVLANRPRLLHAVRHWLRVGRPQGPERPMGSFEEWSGTVGGVLHACGVTGFLANRESLLSEHDDSSATFAQLLRALAIRYPNGTLFRTTDVVSRMDLDSELSKALPPGMRRNADGLARALGRAFSTHSGRHFGKDGLRVERAATHLSRRRGLDNPGEQPDERHTLTRSTVESESRTAVLCQSEGDVADIEGIVPESRCKNSGRGAFASGVRKVKGSYREFERH